MYFDGPVLRGPMGQGAPGLAPETSRENSVQPSTDTSTAVRSNFPETWIWTEATTGYAAARCCYNTIECDLNKPMYVQLCEKMTGCLELPVHGDLRDLLVSRELRPQHRRLMTGNRTSCRLPIRPPLFGLISQKHGFGQKRRLGTAIAVTHFVHGCWHKNCMFSPLLHLDT